jgi:hypothetical protein
VRRQLVCGGVPLARAGEPGHHLDQRGAERASEGRGGAAGRG